MWSASLSILKQISTAIVFTLMILVLSGSSCSGPNNDPDLSRKIISGGQAPYDHITLRPARTDWSPGLVFLGSSDGDAIAVDDIFLNP